MPDKLKVLDLFSGIGGFSLGLERTGGFSTVAFCEIEPFPRKVLAKHWPEVPIHLDIRELKGDQIGSVDLICGGYPCQPFSTAGKRRGKTDDRHLWPEFSRLVAELRPAWVIGENVAGHISMGLDDVLSDLEGQGYACRTFVIPACAVGAHHRRDRCWTVAHSGDVLQTGKLDGRTDNKPTGGSESGDECKGQASQRKRVRFEPSTSSKDVAHSAQLQRDGCAKHRKPSERQVPKSGKRGCPDNVGHTPSERQQGQGEPQQPVSAAPTSDRQASITGEISVGGEWIPEPNVGRVANGVSNRVDRLKGLGNAVVPQIPELLGHAILSAHGGQS